MKNVTIALDEETHRRARIRAAELGTSLSALVKAYLEQLGSGETAPATGVREMPTSFTAMPPVASGAPPKPRKPRQPGALKGKIWVADDFDVTPDWLIDAFEGKDSDLPWPE
ncbi:hypothetical protein KNJ79_10840 [Sphingopyxis indica]|uniref:hypothetical protein n=1 Tax=Sphingopyxis indica TaxID=436663 RepID=UPI002938DD0A|nr:hypothetical protein [Sphingopyxis indica]WOF41757.1 hypothetical protein KNJ79_10840 [Sphingopyxis indica]